MKQNRKEKRLLAMVLSVLLAVNSIPAVTFAEGQAALGLCEHHLEHTNECGFAEGQTCEHDHSEDCYTDELICGYDGTAETTATDSDADHTHIQACYALDCPHERGEHDDTCCYVEAQPCGYTCELCGKADNEPELPPSGNALIKTIMSWTFVGDDNLNEGVLPLMNVSMEQQVDFDMVVSMLPTGILAEIEGETEAVPVDITGWSCPEYVQDENDDWPVSGEYVFTAELRSGYACDLLPTVKALIGGAELYAEEPITGEGYSFDPANKKLTVSSDAGTTGWRNDERLEGFIKDVEELEMTNEVTCIGKDAFWECTSLTSVTIPDGVTTIGDLAFSECTSLTSVTIPDGVTTIGALAFSECTSLTSVTIPDGVTIIGQMAFLKCTSLTSVIIPNSVTTIGNNAFQACTSLTSVIIPDSVTTISGGAFLECTSLTSVIIPDSVTTIGHNAFQACTSLTNVIIPDSVATINGGAFSECTSLTSVIIPNSVTTIGGNAFRECASLISVTIPDSVTTIEENTFWKCASLTSVTIPDSVTTIGDLAFSECTSLTSVTIPNSVTTIGRLAFEGCTGLTSVTINRNPAPDLGSQAFFGNSADLIIHVPEGATGYVGENWPTDKIVEGSALPLTALSISSGTLTPAFCMGQQTYTATVPATVDSVTVMPSAKNATITVNGKNVISGDSSEAIRVEAGKDNEIKIVVRTSDTLDRTYTITVTRTRPLVIDVKAISGVAAPVRGDMPVTKIAETNQYTGTVSWNPNHSTFAADTDYTAIITLIPKAGYTLQGVPENFFTVEGAVSVTNAANSGEITAVFQKTDKAPVDLKAIEGIAAPVVGAVPVTAVTQTAQYTGTVNWTPNHSTFAADTDYTATITLIPKAGCTLQGVPENFFTVEGVVSVTNAANSGVITAVFPKTDKQVYNVTVETSGNGNAGTSLVNAAEGETVTLSATADSGYHFKEWQVISGGIIITDNRFTMPAGDVTVRAVFEKNSSGYSGGGGGSSSGGSAVTVPKDSYTGTGNQIGQSVSRSDLQSLADAGRSLTIQSGTAVMTFGPAALKAILAAVPATAGNISFAAVPADISAFPNAAALIGTRPAYSFTIGHKDSNGNVIPVNVNFPAGSASVSLNYTPAEGEVTGSLFMVYVDGQGAVTWIDKSSYTDGKVLADVPHFSVYGVARKASVPAFTDIKDHWAREDIEFAAARGLFSGTGEKVFSPDAAMTRGMFVTALGRLAGINPDSYQTRSFTDVKADAYYAAYVEWAVQKNITGGTGGGLFSPDAPVTREQMAVMMTNYFGQMGYTIPSPLADATFADNDKISTWAAKEVAAMQRAGIIRGRDGNRFSPQENATRAEGSAVLHRFVERVIDPSTAAGWVRNDSGHWLYYQGRKAVTGWREIAGKWYYFDENGIMAVNTNVDGHEIGADGARKE